TDTEQLLCDIWQDILGLEQVGVTDNFFRLGGHSLLLIQMLSRLQDAGHPSDVRQLFSANSLGELAEQLDHTASHEGVDTAEVFVAPANLIPEVCEHITPDMLSLITLAQEDIDLIARATPGGVKNIQDIYPLAPLQEGILFHHQMSDGKGDAYVMPVLLSAKTRVQRDEFLKALQGVVNRHDVLRTAVLWEGLPQAVQVVCREIELPIEHFILDPDQATMPQLQAKMAPAQQWMDITQAPLLRIHLTEDLHAESEQYFILLQLHHIISDHVGLEIIQSEVQAIFSDNENRLRSPVPYREFVAHAKYQSTNLKAEQFFKEKLGDVSEPTAPFDLLDVHGSGDEIFEASQLFPIELSRSIRKVSQRLAVSPAALFHTGFALVVGACSGRNDVVFGTVLSGRLQGTSGVEQMMGMFINTLPYRLNLKGKKSENAVRLAQTELSILLSYEQASLVLAQQSSGLPSGTPLFSAMLNYRHSSPENNDITASTGIKVLDAQERSNYPFSISVDDLEEDFALTAQMNKTLDPERVVGYLQVAMDNLVKTLEYEPQKPLLDISVLFEKERHQLQIAWNDTKKDYPQELCIHELFEVQAEKYPDAIALTYEDQQLSYRGLNQKANQLAHYLSKVTVVGPEILVGVCLDRSFDMVIAILGVLKAGGAYVPLDPEYPEARLKYLIDDAGLDTVITHKEILDHTSVLPQQALCLDDVKVREIVSEQSDINIESKSIGLQSNHLAYVVYTSGSTGNPKGVMIEHSGLVNLVGAQVNRFEVKEESSVIQFASSSFDAAVSEWGMALCSGAKLVLISSQTPETLHDVIKKQSITHATLPPALLPFLDENIWKSVGHIIVAGEHCSRELADKWSRNRKFYNAYGPSESTVCTSIGNYYEGQSCIHIGRPIDNINTYILNNNQLAPFGVVGELHVGGVGLARGYLNRSDLTAEKFIPNPFSENAEDRLYKTGDLVRWLPDGNLEYMGRIDHQVKVRGFRIELGEIENKLLSLESIQESVVIAREDHAGDKHLVAYIVLNETAKTSRSSEADEALNIEQINQHVTTWRTHLNQSLPEYMVPSSFVVLDNIPLTPNGKVDRKALPAPDVSQQQERYVAPSTDTEKLLCDIWQDILGLEQVGVTDNFFRLGGHSLLLIRVLARLQDEGHSTNVKRLFSAANLGELARHLDDLSKHVDPNDKEHKFTAPVNLIPESSDVITPEMLSLVKLTQLDIDKIVSLIPSGAENIQDIYPLAPLQEGILFHHQISESAGDPYVTNVLLEMINQQQRQDFLNALKIVINRHDILRSAVLWQGLPQAVQVVCRDVELPITRFKSDRGRELKPQLLAQVESVEQSIDFSKAPLLQVQLAEDPESDRCFILLQLHHIISDHVGLEIIQADVQEIIKGNAHTLTKPIPYREFVAHSLYQEKQNNAEAFFKEKLGDIASPSIPFELFDVHGDGNEIIEASQLVPQGLSKDVRELSQRMGVTPAAFFHVVFGLVVGACSGRSDLVFGTVLSGRLQGTSGAEKVLGLFINTLPYRLTLQGISVKDVVLKAQSELSDLLSYEQASLALAQQCSGLPSGTALFSAILNYRHSAPIGVETPNELGIKTLAGRERTNYPFTVSIDDYGDAFSFTAQVNEKVDPERVLGYLQTALKSLVEALDLTPEKASSAISVVPNTERDQLLTDWNATHADYPQDRCIHALFEAQAEKAPDAIALTFEDQHLSYGELNQQANQLAHYLVNEKQVSPDTLVGICLERSLDMVIAILGILKAGGAYVPLDPDYPEARLDYTIKDTELTTVLTRSDINSRTPVSPEQALCLNDFEIRIRINAQSKANLTLMELSASHLAYVIYTSGSTGKPKGVAVEHKNVTSLAINAGYVPLSVSTVMLHNSTVTFDAATFELWGTLLNGGRLVIQPERLLDMEALGLFIKSNHINTAWMTSGLFDQFVSIYRDALPEFQYLLVGGDVVNTRSVEKMLSTNANIQLINGYGPTENTTFSTSYPILLSDTQKGSIPIGSPLNNRKAYVVDSVSTELKLSPMGGVGELYVGGDGLSRGYLNHSELTNEKFIPNPFSKNTQDRLYKTGDLVRWLADGNLEYMGRIDAQVKIRGFRIELGEIENTLLSQEYIQECVVIAREDQAGDKRLVAYVVLEEAVSVAQDNVADSEYQSSWRDYLSQHLPDYMVPSSFVVLDQIPLTSNGKVDRKVLPEPDLSPQQEQYVAPSSDTEKLLCEIWRDILGLEKVGVTDNFFHLGGHSLIATQIVSRLQKRIGVTVPVQTLFESPTIQGLAKKVKEILLIDYGKKIEIKPIPKHERTAGIRLSHTQQRLWFIDQLEKGSAKYNMPLSFLIEGEIDIVALERSIKGIVERHAVLRTSFEKQDDIPIQVVHEAFNFKLQVSDFSNISKSEVLQERTNTLISQLSVEPFSLDKAPLLRAHLIKQENDKCILVLVMHHIVSDGWSFGIVLRELAELYRSHKLDVPVSLPPLQFQYLDYAYWQRLPENEKKIEQQMSYWERSLKGLPALSTFPPDKPRPSQPTFRGKIENFSLPSLLSRDVSDVCAQNGVSLYMAFLTLLSVLISKYARQSDIAIGSPIANRRDSDLENLIGYFANTLVIRTEVDSKASLRDLLMQVKENTLQVYENQDVPFDKVVEVLNPVRSINHEPLFQVMLAVHNMPSEELMPLSGLTIKPLEMDRVSSLYDLTVNITESSDSIDFGFEYNTELFRSQTIERISRHIAVLAKTLVSDIDSRICDISLLSIEEITDMKNSFNKTEKEFPQELCIHQLFERNVEKQGHKKCLTYGGESLSYDSLNQRSNKIAHYLIEQGITPNSFVGVCLDRSLEMMVALLAILKSGASYVPLDPAYPKSRLKYMLEDSGVSLVLTRKSLGISGLFTDKCIPVDVADANQFDSYSSKNIDPNKIGLSSSNLAYVIYTSGSTGKPKGVMVAHRSVVNMLFAMKEKPGMSENDKILAAASISFDMHVMEIYLPLLVGAETVLSSEEQGRNPVTLSNLISSESVTMMQATPSTWKMLQSIQWQPESKIKIICGGEALDDGLKRYLANLPTVELWNLYGPTEASVWVSAKIIINGEAPVTLAGPINNTQFYVLDEGLNVVPVGVAGELHIGGAGLAKGYLNRIELTNEKFICSPFETGERLYKTGDLVRWLPNGELEFLGRTDHQVKIRGYRIELGEITSVIKTHAKVRDAVVVDVYNPSAEHELVAYIVADTGNAVNLDEMRKHVGDSLPPYMQPQEFILIDEIPLSPNKKADRNALMQAQGLRLSGEHVLPETEREKALVSIWQNVLGERKFGVKDNFFEVGGNSILLVKLQSEIEKKMSVSVEMMDLFRYPTIKTILDYLESSPRQENVQERSQSRARSRHKAMQKNRNKKREKV
ncbi:MAG: amino acid adenylation domain-containing protein, partial [Agarilytica sp.]